MKTTIRSALVMFTLLASTPALDARRVLADAPPKDTSAIKTLTPEEAKKLEAVPSRRLNLNSLTSLSPESAAVLAGFKGEEVCLDGLTTLNAATAERVGVPPCADCQSAPTALRGGDASREPWSRRVALCGIRVALRSAMAQAGAAHDPDRL